MQNQAKNDYMMMMSGSYAVWDGLSPEERQQIMERYHAFVRRLKDEGRFKGGSALARRRSRLSAEGDLGVRVVDGPFADTKEAMNGYFIIEAADFAEALQIARDCPCLTHGESVEVLEHSNH